MSEQVSPGDILLLPLCPIENSHDLGEEMYPESQVARVSSKVQLHLQHAHSKADLAHNLLTGCGTGHPPRYFSSYKVKHID